MKTLSKWARANPVTARILIACCHILLVLHACILGFALFVLDWGESRLLLTAAAIVFGISYLLYPKKSRKTGWFRHSYARQKTHDFSLVLSYALVIALGFNNFATREEVSPVPPDVPRQMSMVSAPESVVTSIPERFRHLNEKPRELKKQIRHELKALKKDLRKQGNKGMDDGAKIVLILLTIAATLLLGYLLTVLACNIACSGQEGLAWVVWLGGGAGLIFLMILVIRNIARAPEKSDL